MTNRSIGSKIKEARQAENLTQSQLATRMGCSVKTISRWEHDKFNPSHEELVKLKTILDIELDNHTNRETVETSENDIASEISKITMAIEDMRLETIRKANVKLFAVVVGLIIIFALVLIGLLLWTDWKNPNEVDDQPVVIYYYSNEED